MERLDMEQKIRSAMKKQKTYSKASEMAIEQAAIPLSQCAKLASDLDNASGIFDDCDGNNPNVQKSYLMLKLNEQNRKWLRELHLTPDTMEESGKEDTINKLNKEMNNV